MSAIDQFNHLTPAAQCLTRQAARPQIVVVAGICILVGLGASTLGFASIDRETGSLLTIFSKTLCGPGGLSGNASATFLLSAAIWTSMTIVMMLPGAAPMLLTYGEIVETAAEKGVAAVSPLILTGGYLTVWSAFAVFAAAIETLFMRNFPSLETSTQTYLAGASFLLAGAYQFSSLKHACLTRCRRPFAFFFANWTDRTAGVFRLGLQQGLSCLGCCWALMLTMLALGSMNLIWMIALAIVMAFEKTSTSQILPRSIGGALILAGLLVLFSAFNPSTWGIV